MNHGFPVGSDDKRFHQIMVKFAPILALQNTTLETHLMVAKLTIEITQPWQA